MNEDTKYRDRHIAGVMISRVLKKTGLSAKAGGIVGAVVVSAAAVGGYYGIDIVLDDEPMPEPPPIIAPLNETSTPPLIEGPEEPNKITNGQSQPPAPSSNGGHQNGHQHHHPKDAPEQVNTQTAGDTPVPAPTSPTEEPEWSPTPTNANADLSGAECGVDCPRCPTPAADRGRVPQPSPRDRDIYSRGYSAGILARSHIDFGPIPLFDPRTHPDRIQRRRAGPDAAHQPQTYTDTDCDHNNIRYTPDYRADPHCDHDNIACTLRRRPRRPRESNASPKPSPTGLEITWAVRFPWGVPAEAPEWAWDSMNGQIYGESTSDLLDYPRLRMAVRVGNCDAKLQVVGDLDGRSFPLGSGEVTFKLLGTGQAADIAAGPFADYYYATEGIKVSEASVSVTVYDEIAASLELPPYAETFGTKGTNPNRQRAAEKCAEETVLSKVWIMNERAISAR